MPRGIPKNGRKRRNAAVVAADEQAVDDNGQPIVAGEEEEAPTLGEAVEIVRSTLAHFDASARKSVVRAATMLLK